MTAADWHEVTFTVCLIASFAAVAFIAGCALGWVEGSLSIRLVPPWKRRAAEPKVKAAPEAEEPATVPPMRRAS